MYVSSPSLSLCLSLSLPLSRSLLLSRSEIVGNPRTLNSIESRLKHLITHIERVCVLANKFERCGAIVGRSTCIISVCM